MQLCFDFDRVPVTPVPVASVGQAIPSGPQISGRRRRGQRAFQSGLMAEDSVAEEYRLAGYDVIARRWRGRSGEIDLILRRGAQYIFAEVKSAADFSRAAERINRRQMDRICNAACEFCATLPSGQMTEMRLDAALVDRFGRVEILENAFAAD